jgi:hypothetical protein
MLDAGNVRIVTEARSQASRPLTPHVRTFVRRAPKYKRVITTRPPSRPGQTFPPVRACAQS